MLRDYRLSTRINLSGIAVIVCFICAVICLYPRFREKMYEAKYAQTQNVVETVFSMIAYYAKESDRGNISEEQAKTSAKEVVRHLRYEGKEYFWIHDTDIRMIMHPMKTELEGKELSDFSDIHGKKLFVSMTDICKKQGAGFTDYYWPKPGETLPSPKISYTRLFPEWGWIIGSGIYTDDVEKEIRQIITLTGMAIFVITSAALLFSWFLARTISKPISDIAGKMNDAACQIAAASDEVSQSAQSLAENASEQAAVIEESSASIEEIEARSLETSELTRGAEALMNENIRKSGLSLRSLISVITEMSQIEQEGSRIGEIIRTIEEIAFRTKLLALNAAVEAARAGKAGAGFAVVADEVKNLAMSAAAAAESTQKILDTTIRRVASASQSVKAVNSDFEGIIETATSMGEKTVSITEASKEQSLSIGCIRTAAVESDKVTQQLAAGSQEFAAAAQELSAQASEMKSFAKDLLLIVEGKKRDLKIEN